jgi:tRNA-Thr(GGU) m(6)t(6)A37 methyltransferase TsaA
MSFKPRRCSGAKAEAISSAGESMDITFKSVGIVRTPATDEDVKAQSQPIQGELEIYPEFAAALGGIDGYSHLFILCYIHQLRPEQIGPLQVKPRRLLRRGFTLEELPSLGVFALDSPTRPNPIGLTLVRFLKRQGCRLLVEGLDYFDGTPILDIKGYGPNYRADDYTVPKWQEQLSDAMKDV